MTDRRRCLLFALVLLVAGLLPTAAAASLTGEVVEEIRSFLNAGEAPRQLVLGEEAVAMQLSLPRFYAERDYQPAWFNDRGLLPQARQLLDILRDAAEEGLCPQDYHLVYLEDLLALVVDARRFELLLDPLHLAHLDLLLTDAFLLYASHQVEGRVDPESVHTGWKAQPRKVDLVRLLGYALEGGRLREMLAGLVPSHRGYRELRRALQDYRRLSALGGWPTVPDGPLLHPGDWDSRVPLLRERLRLSGDLAGDFEEAGELYDRLAAQALARFQSRHGLTADGVLGPKTLAKLNRSVEERIRQIELNLERWRWLPKSLGSRHLLVNIADFRLQVVEQGRTILSMLVVVGTSYRKTPVFSASMSYLIFAPYWNVPPTILREDKLPKIKADPGFLGRHHFEIVRGGRGNLTVVDPRDIRWKAVEAHTFPGQLRQKPGPWNPLGRVKFMFPNRFAVYLHDTPDRYLFDREVRSFSSGCIRIERPMDLAQYLLEGFNGWNCERLLAAFRAQAPFRVDLPSPLPVHILYFTAWVDEAGEVNFRDDPYLRDVDLELALARRFREVQPAAPPDGQEWQEPD